MTESKKLQTESVWWIVVVAVDVKCEAKGKNNKSNDIQKSIGMLLLVNGNETETRANGKMRNI